MRTAAQTTWQGEQNTVHGEFHKLFRHVSREQHCLVPSIEFKSHVMMLSDTKKEQNQVSDLAASSKIDVSLREYLF